jgi:hypothetical protein
MGKINSPAGEISFEMKSFKRTSDGLVILATMGVWESEIYFSYSEALRFFLSPSLFLTIIVFPIALIRGMFKRKNK